MAIANTSRRLYIRGNVATFKVSFFNDVALTSPMVPQDALVYPAYTIYDIDNQPIQSGVGQAETSPGMYKVDLLIPVDALLSNDDQRWRIEWAMVTVDLRQVDFVEEFDVKDVVITASETREQRFNALMGRDYRTSLRLGYQPAEVMVSVFGGGNMMNTVYSAAYGAGVLLAEDGDSRVFYVDIPSNVLMPGSTYSIIWSTRAGITDPLQDTYQSLTIITPILLESVISVRQVIDKFQKRLGTVQAYEDSDITEYLRRGQQLLNATYPTTFYGFGFLPDTLGVFHILFASWYGLQAQQLLETDLGINFCLDENTFVPTSKGIFKAKQLYNRHNLRQKLFTEVYGNKVVDLLQIIAENHSQENCIVRSRDLSYSGWNELAIGSALGRIGIKSRHSRESNWWNWNFAGFDHEISERFGIGAPDKVADCPPIKTPYGYQVPTAIYKLESKPCLEVVNELGYSLTTTTNHPFLVFNRTTLNQEWVRAENLKTGDLIAMDTQPCVAEYSDDLAEERDLVNDICGPNTHGKCDLPSSWSVELGRLIGYLVAEGDVTGDNNLRFFNTDQALIDSFISCLAYCFPGIKYSVHVKDNNHSGFAPEVGSKPLIYVDVSSTRLRRMLYALGLEYKVATEKSVPERIFSAPDSAVVGFLQGFVEGDGCFSVDKRRGSKLQLLILATASKTLSVELQQLLLMRFGIISTRSKAKTCYRVAVSGKYIRMYMEKVGALFKGQDFDWSKSNFRCQKENQFEILSAFRSVLKYRGKVKYKFAEWGQIEEWYNHKKDEFRETSPEACKSLEDLISHKFIWTPVKETIAVGERTVIDPSFVGTGATLDHAFMAGGFVTHNTGQTVTLDYDHAGHIADIAGKWEEFINKNLPPAKMAIVRATSAVGTVAGRGYRPYQPMFTYKVSSSNINQVGGLAAQLTTMGLLW